METIQISVQYVETAWLSTKYDISQSQSPRTPTYHMLKQSYSCTLLQHVKSSDPDGMRQKITKSQIQVKSDDTKCPYIHSHFDGHPKGYYSKLLISTNHVRRSRVVYCKCIHNYTESYLCW